MPDPLIQQPPGKFRGRVLVAAAAILWSTAGIFAKNPTFADWPADARGMMLAFWRALFAGLLILPAVRRPRWNWRLVPMAAAFATMNALYLTAMVKTSGANAIWMQSTAPFWVLVIGLFAFREPIDRRDLVALVFCLFGVGLILSFELRGDEQSGVVDSTGVVCGLAAGVGYGIVVLFLRSLRSENAAWLVAVNHLFTAVVLLPIVVHHDVWPSGGQLPLLAAFGFFQMALPYLLFTRGLEAIRGQEASGIGLLEPVLLPIWIFLCWGEQPKIWTLAGAALILIGLALRYALPARGSNNPVCDRRDAAE